MYPGRFRSFRALLAPLVLLLGLAVAAPACAPATATVELAPASAAPDLPLWEVTRPGSTVYLLGSVHLLRPEAYPLDEAIYEAFNEARVVVFEIDMAELMANAPLMMEAGMFDDGHTLPGVLPAALYAEVERRATGMGLPMPMLERMKPWLVGLTLSSLVLQQAGYDAESGIDLHFHQRAVEGGKQIIGLETIEEQIAVFDGLSMEAQVAFLEATLDQLDDTVAELDRATAYWQRGDTEGLAEIFIESMGDQPEVMERLLFERNRNWIPPIVELIEQPGTAIVIVGMGHLVGEGSVIELLRQRGYEVTQLRAERAVGSGL